MVSKLVVPSSQNALRNNREVSSGKETSQLDTVFKQQFGISKEDIKRLPIRNIEQVTQKVAVLQEYVRTKRLFAESVASMGGPQVMLLNELADMQAMLSEKETGILEQGLRPVDDPEYLELKSDYVEKLMRLQKLGIDFQRLDLEKERQGADAGVAFVVEGKKE